MTAAYAATSRKFLRKTTLLRTEANTNFKMLDDDVAEAITSAEADEVTPLMSKIYTRLLLTPVRMREGGRVLRFAGEETNGKWVTAWEQLLKHLRVSSETARKALRWMHGQGIIGYFAGKNGVGIRIFLNRAANSVSAKREAREEKNLPFSRASNCRPCTSPGETPFKDSFAVSEVLDSDLNPLAPKNGADNTQNVETSAGRCKGTVPETSAFKLSSDASASPPFQRQSEISSDQVVQRLQSEIEPLLRQMVRRAAAEEHERTRDWLERNGLPKAARVAQRETYDVLRRNGVIRDASLRTPGAVGSGGTHERPAPRHLSESELGELAEICVALFEVKGQSFEVTLAGMGIAAGGILLPEDVPRVLRKARALSGVCRGDV